MWKYMAWLGKVRVRWVIGEGQNCVLSPKAPIFSDKFKFWRQMTPNFWKLFSTKTYFFLKSGAIYYFHRKVAKFRKILIILSHFDLLLPDAPTFFSSLSPNALGFGRLSLTPVSIPPPPPGWYDQALGQKTRSGTFDGHFSWMDSGKIKEVELLNKKKMLYYMKANIILSNDLHYRYFIFRDIQIVFVLLFLNRYQKVQYHACILILHIHILLK